VDAAAAIAVGVAAEGVAFARPEVGDWLPDVLVGWTLVGAGLAGRLRGPHGMVGGLVEAAGFAWFAGNFAQVGFAPAAWLAAQLLFLHRGLLIHAVVAFPTGRPMSLFGRTVVFAGYLTAVVTALGRSDAVMIAVGGLLVLASGPSVVRWARGGGPADAVAAAAALTLAAGLAGSATIRLASPSGSAYRAALLAYDAALAATGLIVALGLLVSRWQRAALTDLVVELSEARSGTLRDALARALADPSVQIGYWVADAQRYVDAAGRPFDVPETLPGRGVTPIVFEASPVAVLVHDPLVLRGTDLLGSISAAARLAAVNARLHAQVRAVVDDLQASRRRLVEAADDERARLEQRLHDGPARALRETDELLARLRCTAEQSGAAAVAEQAWRAEEQLRAAQRDLGELARGLHPRDLDELGLAGALQDLAGRAPIRVAVTAVCTGLPRRVAAAVYFTCAEAVTNVVKYAGTSRCSIAVTQQGDRVLAEVIDDGVGGADPTLGTGLRGLADRIGAIGGTFTITSSPSVGTRVAADIPLTP